MNINEEQQCKLCAGHFTIIGILDNAQSYWPELNVLHCQSPCCKKTEELQLKTGQIERGYVYAASSPHFAGMEQYQVPDLVVSKTSKALTFKLNNTESTINAKL
jgi:hypothetical protein